MKLLSDMTTLMNDEYILRHFGGVHQNSLKYVIADDEHNPADHDVLDIITHSPYTEEENLMADLTIKHNDFTILSLNCQSFSKNRQFENYIKRR